MLLQPQRKIQKVCQNKNLNFHSRNTKDYNQQAQHQLDFMVHPKIHKLKGDIKKFQQRKQHKYLIH